MNPESLFGIALGITPPWEVEGIEFSKENKRLDIKIDAVVKSPTTLAA